MIDPTEKALATIARVAKRAPEELRPELDLASDLEIGSAEALELLATLEDELDVEISELDAARMRTVGCVLDFVRKARATA